jgi:TonB family protein
MSGPFSVNGIGALVVAVTVVCSSAQDNSSHAAFPHFVKVCSDKNPPPCATSPHAVYSPPPEYSGEGRDAQIEGKVVLWAIVGEDGRAHYIRVARTLGHGLDEQAIKTLKEWKFKPGMSGGAPAAVAVNVEMDFRLR